MLMNCSNKQCRLPDCHSYHRGRLLLGVVRGQICVACFPIHVLSVREVLTNSMCFCACLWSVFLFQSMSLRSVQTVPHNVGYLSSLHINPWCFIVFWIVHVEGNLIVLFILVFHFASVFLFPVLHALHKGLFFDSKGSLLSVDIS
jgi:hypothetical protein